VSEVTEYGLLMSGGGFHVRNTDPEIEQIYPVAQWIANEIRTRGRVYRRRVIVVEEWTEITSASPPVRQCPFCLAETLVTPEGALAEHTAGSLPAPCAGSGVTVKGEHQ
jgi:hypothetical protein